MRFKVNCAGFLLELSCDASSTVAKWVFINEQNIGKFSYCAQTCFYQPVAMGGGFGWLSPPKPHSKTQKLKHELHTSAKFLSTFRMSIPPEQTQSLPMENFLATVLASTINYFHGFRLPQTCGKKTPKILSDFQIW